MNLLRSGVDITVIAMWLGHEQVETAQIYLHADLGIKERALARTTPPNTTPGRYHTPMPFSPSSKLCDYAELLQPFSAVLLASSTISA